MDPNNIGLCIEAHDLAVSKLMAFRPKDTIFVRTLIVEDMVTLSKIKTLLAEVPEHHERVARAKNWILKIEKELHE